VTASREGAAALGRAGLYLRGLKARPRTEYANALIFRPLAHLLVLALYRTPVRPTAVLLCNTVAGLAAAGALARGDLVPAALLLQVKTILDNADGQLARVRGEESETGRYLDTELDLLVNAAVFLALATYTGAWVLAAISFLLLTLVLGADFNLERLYRLERGEYFRPAPETSRENQRLLAFLAGFYRLVFSPQDRMVQALVRWRLGSATRGLSPAATQAARLAYHDGLTLGLAANAGLSTQLLVLGVSLVAGAPLVFLWLQPALALCLVAASLGRERKARRAAIPG
jgi:archaetidylinositol phosphate synthase